MEIKEAAVTEETSVTTDPIHPVRFGVPDTYTSWNLFRWLEEKDLTYELVTEFRYHLLVGENSPLCKKDDVSFDDLGGLIEIVHAEPYLPTSTLPKVMKEEIGDDAARRIFINERGSQFDILARNPETFMWVSLVPGHILERYHLEERSCSQNTKNYRDVLVYRNGYKLSSLDKQFITALCEAKRKIR